MSDILIIAEAGVNHNGSLDMAMDLIDIAAEAGADMVKFQSFRAESIASANAPKADYQVRSTGGEESQADMLSRLELSPDDHERLVRHCAARRIRFLSTPFDIPSLDLLVSRIGMHLLKLPSGEITNARLLLAAAASQCSLILSTGMASLGEIEQALGVLAFGIGGCGTDVKPSRASFEAAYADPTRRGVLAERVILLHCTTEYPADFADANLRAIATLKSAFGLPVGYSDHTLGIAISVAAVACGAEVIEKHFTLDRSLPGPDHAASLEPDELKAMVTSVRQTAQALGDGLKTCREAERKNREVVRKSLVAACLISKGERFTTENIAVKRPGWGRSPFDYWELLGRRADRDYVADAQIA